MGATITVDGIATRGDYDYAPPQGFFDPTSSSGSLSGPGIYRAADYGAVTDPTVDNRAAIQAAIDAAHADGGGVVVLDAGVYGVAGKPKSVGSVHLKDNVFLKGAGIGETALRVIDGWDGKLTGIVRTPWGEATKNYGLADLTLDGNRQNTTGKVDGYFSGGMPGGTVTDEDAWILRVETQNNSGYGFDPHERTERLLIAECVSHDNGLDGFVADFIIDGVYRDNVAYDNDRHGFNICTTTQDFLLKDNIARDNGGAGIVIQRGSFDIPLAHNILIDGGEMHGNTRDGVLVQMADHVEVRNVDIYENGTYGVRVIGSRNVTVVDNTITDNSRTKDGAYAGVQIRDDEDLEISGGTFTATDNLVTDNKISWSDGLSGSYGVEERAGEVGRNTVDGNQIAGDVREIVKLAATDSAVIHTDGAAGTRLVGGRGNDTLKGGKGADTLYGAEGDDLLSGDTNDDLVHGGAGNDRIYGKDGADTCDGGIGDDWISGGKGDDVILGGDGTDEIHGNTGHDTISGGEGADRLRGNDGDDIVLGDGGDDWISGGKGRDEIHGGDGNDRLKGDSNFDVLFGDAGDDTLIGGSGNDRLYGGSGRDILTGGTGTDVLAGGSGDDTLTGHSGSDDFVFAPGMGADTVTDFKPGTDDIDLTAFLFADFDAVASRLTTSQNGDTVMTLGDDETVTLVGVDALYLDAGDFLL